jgi:hypothetical protein
MRKLLARKLWALFALKEVEHKETMTKRIVNGSFTIVKL